MNTSFGSWFFSPSFLEMLLAESLLASFLCLLFLFFLYLIILVYSFNYLAHLMLDRFLAGPLTSLWLLNLPPKFVFYFLFINFVYYSFDLLKLVNCFVICKPFQIMHTLFHNVSKIVLGVCLKYFVIQTVIDTRILKTYIFLVSR